MKGHVNPFAVTVGALVGACFPPILGWCRHDDSHFLRALWTKQHPGVSNDRLVRLVILHRHDEFPPLGKNYASDQARPVAEPRLYKIAH
jgi:hypothetical protein